MFVSSYTALKLPKSVEDLCRDVYAHFHRSLKRQDVYREFIAKLSLSNPLPAISWKSKSLSPPNCRPSTRMTYNIMCHYARRTLGLRLQQPSMKLRLKKRKKILIPRSLGAIFQKLQYLKDDVDLRRLDMQWRSHVFEDNAKPELQWSEYWLNIRDAKTPSGEWKYQDLIRFVSRFQMCPLKGFSVCRRWLKRIREIRWNHRSWFLYSMLRLGWRIVTSSLPL